MGILKQFDVQTFILSTFRQTIVDFFFSTSSVRRTIHCQQMSTLKLFQQNRNGGKQELNRYLHRFLHNRQFFFMLVPIQSTEKWRRVKTNH